MGLAYLCEASHASADYLNNSVEGIAIWPSTIQDMYGLSPSSGGVNEREAYDIACVIPIRKVHS